MAEAMMDEGLTPLDGVIGSNAYPIGGPADAGVVLSERRHRGKLVLRGDAGDKNFLAGAAKALGMAPPVKPNTTAGGMEAMVVWTAPNEWLVVTDPEGETALEAALSRALDGIHHAVTDTSDHSTTIRLSGGAARTVLAKGCALDLHPREFKTGDAAQAHLAQAQVIIWQVDETPIYDIHVRASFAPYLWAWLVDAGLEFGVRVEA
jgi:sarcosine oxidase, subunit gamma